MAEAARKLNRSGGSHSGHFSCLLDLSVFGDVKLNGTDRVVFSALQSFSLGDRYSEFTQKEIAERYHSSRPSVARSMRKVLSCGKFERGEKVYQYKFKGEIEEKPLYIYVHDWLFSCKFERNGQAIYLPKSWVFILCYLWGFGANGLTASMNYIASKVDLSADTVGRAMKYFKEQNIVKVTYKDERISTVNSSTLPKFVVNGSLLQKYKKQTVRFAKGVSDAVKEADLRTDRERYYEERKRLDQDRIQTIKNTLMSYPEFAEAERELPKLEMRIGQAEGRGDRSMLQKCLEERFRLKKQWREAMARLGYAEEDLQPHAVYVCAQCRDTGEREDHTFCDCWRRRPR